MKGEQLKLLEHVFIMDEITDEMISQVLDSSNNITSTLFDLISQELPHINEDETKRKVIQNACNYLYKKLMSDLKDGLTIPVKNLKNLQYKLKKIPTDKRYQKEIKDILWYMEELLDKNTFLFLEYIIYHMRDLNKLSMVLKKNKMIVNSKDGNDTPLYFRIIQDYMNAVLEFNKKDMLYYNGVLLLLRNKCLQVTRKERNFYLQRINDAIKELDKNDKNYFERKKQLTYLYQFVYDEKENNMTSSNLLNKYHINTLFSERVMGEMYKYTSQELDSRRVFVDEYTITIDKKSTKEIDDALTIKKLSNGNYLLGVHIANVLGYLPYHSEIVDNAINSGKTVYLPNFEKPYLKDLFTIFPLEFSSFSASLIQNERRLANSHFIELDGNANIIHFYSLKTIIRNDAKCSYSYINSILNKGSKNKTLMETVSLLDELTYKLEEQEHQHLGCTRAEAIVELTTRLVNSQIANYFYANEYPFLYRVHELDSKIEQDIEVLKKVKNDSASLNLYKKFRHCFNTRFDTSGFHEKLNRIPYCHGTSPLRRAEDIVVEHCMDICYFSNPRDKDLYLLEDDVKKKKDTINLSYNRIEMFLTENNFLCEKTKQKVKN